MNLIVKARHNKNFVRSLAFIMRFKATLKWAIRFLDLVIEGSTMPSFFTLR